MTAHLTPDRGALLLRRAISTAVLSAGFALTGVGTVLPGILLPLFSEKWGLRDDGAGLLLFLQFSGSSLGALFSGLNRIRSMSLGYALLVVSSLDLVFDHLRTPFAVFFFFGLGLGMAMTSTSLLVSDRSGENRAAKLEWLNFTWSIGATSCPLLLLPLVHRDDIHQVYLSLFAVFFLVLAWVVAAERETKPAIAAVASGAEPRPISRLFLLLLICAVCTVGVESALTGWLTTYSHRTGMQSLAGSALATAVFWLGEILSRLAFSTPLLKKIGRQTVLRLGIWGLTATAIFLIAAPHPWTIIAGAGVAGIFTGPLYPIQLSYLLERSARGWFFAVAGLGAAFFPWITGLVSAHLNSLRLGLLVPCCGASVMLVLTALIFEPAQTENL
ncbi:MAG TPA: MFS transporter [Terracidiphilus sp.]|nr:MFS transporter [Terracidiphilus sp.]